MKKTVRLLLLLAIVLQMTSCYYDVQEELHPASFAVTCDTSDLTFAKVSQILSTNCFSCHSTGAASGNITLDTYEGVKAVADNGRLLGSIEHEAGFRPMPQGLPMLSECDRLIIKKWIDNGSTNN